MNKYFRLLLLKINNKTVLTSSFLNTKIKIKTIEPDIRLSYNQLFNNIKQNKDARHRIDTQSTLEISKL